MLQRDDAKLRKIIYKIVARHLMEKAGIESLKGAAEVDALLYTMRVAYPAKTAEEIQKKLDINEITDGKITEYQAFRKIMRTIRAIRESFEYPTHHQIALVELALQGQTKIQRKELNKSAEKWKLDNKIMRRGISADILDAFGILTVKRRGGGYEAEYHVLNINEPAARALLERWVAKRKKEIRWARSRR